MPLKPRVFISYSRKDGEEFAKELRERLEVEKIPLWQDRVGMEGGRDWWLQIVEAFDKVEFMVLVMTPKALESKIIRKEWRYARQKGVCVYPVKGVPDSELDYDSLPRWMSSSHFYDLENEWVKFVNDLNTRCEIPRVPFMVENLPKDFIPRPGEFDRLINQLLDADREEPVAITAALRGAGGYGKTTLAQAICHDERIQDAFDDGILWVTLGQTPGDLTAKLNNIIEILDGNRPGFTEIQPAMAKLAELLSYRDILFVIDDVWNRAHLNPFLQGGGRCARLITTRNSDTLPPKCEHIDLDAMRQQEAQQLLGFDLILEDTEEIGELSHRLGEWPLLLKMVNGVLRDRVNKKEQSLPDAIAFVNKALDRRGFTAFDSRNPEDRSQAVSSTFSISLDLLSDEEKARYGELAIFPEDVNIPLEAIEKLWQHAGFDDFETETLCEGLQNFSLLLNFDLNMRQISLHDVMRGYLRTKHSSDLKNINARFLSAYGLQNWADLPTNEPYLWKYLAYHLFESEQADALKALLLDFSWLKNKLTACNVNALISDYDYFQHEEDLKLLHGALRLSSNQLTRDQNQLTGHLLGRLMSQKSARIEALLKQATNEKTGPWLRPLFPSLTPPGGPLLRTLEVHSGWVSAVAISPDGKSALSGSWDNTLKVWDLSTADVIHTLEGHSGWVSAVAISPDGKSAISGSGDNTLKVWDLSTGDVIHTLEGHSDSVRAVAINPDGKSAVSGSLDRTLKVWDLNTGDVIHTMGGHSGSVRAVAISPDGKSAVSGSGDRTLKVWDLSTGDVIHTLEGHSSWVSAVAISPDGKSAVSGSADSTLKVWDLNTSDVIHTLEGHSSWVSAVAISPDGKSAVSGSGDSTLKVWDLSIGDVIHTLEGHSDSVGVVVISPGGKSAVSGSNDSTLKVWDLSIGDVIHTLEGHSDKVHAVAVNPDGKSAVSGSLDRTLKGVRTEPTKYHLSVQIKSIHYIQGS